MTARLTVTEVYTRVPLLDENDDQLLDENDDPLYDEWYSHETAALTVTDLTDPLTVTEVTS